MTDQTSQRKNWLQTTTKRRRKRRKRKTRGAREKEEDEEEGGGPPTHAVSANDRNTVAPRLRYSPLPLSPNRARLASGQPRREGEGGCLPFRYASRDGSTEGTRAEEALVRHARGHTNTFGLTDTIAPTGGASHAQRTVTAQRQEATVAASHQPPRHCSSARRVSSAIQHAAVRPTR